MTFRDFLNGNATIIDENGSMSFGGVDDDYPTPTQEPAFLAPHCLEQRGAT